MSEPGSEMPLREHRDPRALRAVAHPVRLSLLEELLLGGPATATELAERVGESPANCSWHLRQLARYGFVAEAGGGTGRQRPWQLVLLRNHWSETDQDSELRIAGVAATEVLFAREYDALRAWLAEGYTESAQWREAAFVAQGIGWLTAAELAAVAKEIEPIRLRYLDRVEDAQARPPGARPIRFVMWGVPARPGPGHDGSGDGDGDGGGGEEA